MFCPLCKAEYREGFTKCADCDVELIENLPEEIEEEELREELADEEFVEILRTRNLSDLSIIKALFDAENICYFFSGEICSQSETFRTQF